MLFEINLMLVLLNLPRVETYKCVPLAIESLFFFFFNRFTMGHVGLLYLSVIHAAANFIPFSLPAF